MGLLLVKIAIKSELAFPLKARVKVAGQELLRILSLKMKRFIFFQFTINQRKKILLIRH